MTESYYKKKSPRSYRAWQITSQKSRPEWVQKLINSGRLIPPTEGASSNVFWLHDSYAALIGDWVVLDLLAGETSLLVTQEDFAWGWERVPAHVNTEFNSTLDAIAMFWAVRDRDQLHAPEWRTLPEHEKEIYREGAKQVVQLVLRPLGDNLHDGVLAQRRLAILDGTLRSPI